MKYHSFSIDDAKEHGVEKAIILNNLRFWLEKNKANDKNAYEGFYWTYNSARAFAKLFPYFTPSKISRLLKQMETDGLILTGNYNKHTYDRTKWYSLPEYSIVEKDETHFAEMKNGNCRSEQPIPYTNTDTNTDINTNTKTGLILVPDEKDIAFELVEFWNENKPSKQPVKFSVWSKQINARLKTFTADEIKTAMLFIINSKWHQNNNQVLIKNVVDSDKRCENVLEKSNQSTDKQGVSNANQQPKQSSSDKYNQMLEEQFNRKYGETTNQTTDYEHCGNVYDMEEDF